MPVPASSQGDGLRRRYLRGFPVEEALVKRSIYRFAFRSVPCDGFMQRLVPSSGTAGHGRGRFSRDGLIQVLHQLHGLHAADAELAVVVLVHLAGHFALQ